MRIALLGPPGSGKLELSKAIWEEYQFPAISEKSLLHDAAAGSSELGKLAKETLSQRRTASDELMLALLRIRLDSPDVQKGFVMIDFPRSTSQAEIFDGIMSGLGIALDLVMQIEVNSDDLMERLVGQSYCRKCGAEYNLYMNPPIVEGVCDMCGSRICSRPADYEENISNQLRVYEMDTIPVLEYFETRDLLVTIDGNTNNARIWQVVNKLIQTTTPTVVEAPPVKKGSARGLEEPPAPDGNQETATSAVKKAVAKTTTTRANRLPARKKTASREKPIVKKIIAKRTPTKRATASKSTAASSKVAPTKKILAKKTSVKATATKKVVKKAVSRENAGTATAAKKATSKKKAEVKKPEPINEVKKKKKHDGIKASAKKKKHKKKH